MQEKQGDRLQYTGIRMMRVSLIYRWPALKEEDIEIHSAKDSLPPYDESCPPVTLPGVGALFRTDPHGSCPKLNLSSLMTVVFPLFNVHVPRIRHRKSREWTPRKKSRE